MRKPVKKTRVARRRRCNRSRQQDRSRKNKRRYPKKGGGSHGDFWKVVYCFFFSWWDKTSCDKTENNENQLIGDPNQLIGDPYLQIPLEIFNAGDSDSDNDDAPTEKGFGFLF